jgi:hypothetical protein
MSETATTETTGTATETPSLASRVEKFFDSETEKGGITHITQDPPKKEAKSEVKTDAKAEPEPDKKEILESETPDEKEVGAKATESESEEEADEEVDAEFIEAAKKHAVPVTLDDLPEEARPLVQKKLKDMERGYTKAMQEARQYRADKAAFDAETKQLDHFIADKIAADPSLIEKINAEVKKRENPDYLEALALRKEAAKDKAEANVEKEQKAEQANRERGEYLESYTASQAKAAGVPFAFVEEAVALAVTLNKSITDDEIQAIVAKKAKVYKQHMGATKGAKTRELVKEKASDAKNAGLKDVPATAARSSASRESATPNANEGQRPLTLREKLEATLDERAAA